MSASEPLSMRLPLVLKTGFNERRDKAGLSSAEFIALLLRLYDKDVNCVQLPDDLMVLRQGVLGQIAATERTLDAHLSLLVARRRLEARALAPSKAEL